jgi:phage nucleotide-binding protein
MADESKAKTLTTIEKEFLAAIESGDETPKYYSMLLYGHPGSGKTSLFKHCVGKTLIIDADKGTRVLRNDVGKLPENISVIELKTDLSNLNEILRYLQNKCDYENVIIDTITEVEKAMLTYFGREGKNNGVPERAHYQQVQFKILDYCREFRSLAANVIFTFWETNFEITKSSGEKFNQARPLISEKIVENVCGLCDIIGRVRHADDGTRFVSFESTQDQIARDRVFHRANVPFEKVF